MAPSRIWRRSKKPSASTAISNPDPSPQARFSVDGCKWLW
jgi:hypothetical protein